MLKEQFDVSFMIKAPIFSQPRFDMFQACSDLESTYYLFRILAMLSFSVIVFQETGLYSMYRKKVIASFERNKTYH